MEDNNNQSINSVEPNNQVLNNVNNDNKNNTFNIIIGISTLLIAILGATFAYFSATARSKENDVSVKSAYVSISYDGGTEIKATNLIPSSLAVTYKSFTKEVEAIGTIDDESLNFISEDKYTNENLDRRCVDKKGREVCYVYQFSVNSDGVEDGTTDILGGIKINTNEFKNLSYTVFEVLFDQDNGQDKVDKFGNRVVRNGGYIPLESLNFTEEDENEGHEEYSDIKFAKFEVPFDKYGDNEEYLRTVSPIACLFGYSDTYNSAEADDLTRCKTLKISNNEKHTFQVMIWLEETGSVQDEQGLSFEGTVNLEVPGGQGDGDYSDGKITGKD